MGDFKMILEKCSEFTEQEKIGIIHYLLKSSPCFNK